MSEPFGIVAAAQRARDWAPQLQTPGQRLVLSALVVYMGGDSTSHPTINPRKGKDGQPDTPGQLEAYTGYSPRAIRRILTELVELGVIAPLNDRSPGGRNRPTKWTIRPPDTRTGESGFSGGNPDPGDRNPDRGVRKPGPGSPTIELVEIVEARDCKSEGHEWVTVGRSVARCRHCREKA